MLGVAPEARGRGVGRALVRAVIARADDTGADRVVLCSLEMARTAHRLYERLGFVRLPERDWYPEPDLLLMAFGLDRPWHRSGSSNSAYPKRSLQVEVHPTRAAGAHPPPVDLS